MPKVLFVFAGTGDVAANIHENYESEPFNDDVVRVYFNGCQDTEIGGAIVPGMGLISPDLDRVGSTIRTCFDKEGNLSLNSLRQQFGASIIIEPQDNSSTIEVESINMVGFSRGGVTTFAVARHLDSVGKPMSLYADDPVPGTSKREAKKNSSEFYKNHDLRGCRHLIHAEVSIGAYKKNVNSLHNKFFRQMAPLFNADCDASVYVVPKTNHWHYSKKADNQKIQFLANRGILNQPQYYNESEDRITFTPKIIQQKHHIGVIGRTEISPRYKAFLHDLVSEHHTIDLEQSFKITQALYALDLRPSSAAKESLYQIVKEDTTITGKAIREFLVEFEAINNYVFRKSGTEATKKAIDNYCVNVYEQLSTFPVEQATPEQQKKFGDDLLMHLKSIKNELPRSEYQELKKLTSSFLKDNVLFHPELTQYIDETETKEKKPSALKDADSAMISVKTARNGDELAEVLYNLSENSREMAYKKFPKNLHEVIQNIQQLEKVIRFLPAKDIVSIFKKTAIKEYINDMDHINSIMNKLPYTEQKIAVFNAVKNDINDLKPTYLQLGKLMQHLPIDKCKSLIKSYSFAKINTDSSADMVQFFDQLDQQKFDKLLPLISKDIQHYLSKRIGKDDGRIIKAYLEERAASSGAKKAIQSIFPEYSTRASAQKILKSQLTTIVKETVLESELSADMSIK